MEVLLDSSFIISCIKRNIDFVSQLDDQGFKVIVPHEVREELKDLRFKKGRAERLAIDLAFGLFEHYRLPSLTLGHRSVDAGLIKKGKEGYYIATLDRAIKRAVPHVIVLLSAQKRVGTA